MTVRPEIIKLKEHMSQEIVGQHDILETLIIGLLANGHLLVEGLPGLAKTRAIKALSNNIEGDFGRIQFTPDLVAGDIVGRQVLYQDEGSNKTRLQFEPGPIFNNIVLADEINRAPSKTQNSLLEAMEERQVTVAAIAHKMPELFLVMATQNPGDQEGTYPLPEAQLDRFLMNVSVDYPDEAAEANIIRMVRGEQSQQAKVTKPKERILTTQKTIFAARDEIDRITVPPHVEKYLVDFIFITRYPERINYELKSYIKLGASPRGSLALDRASRVNAWMKGEDTVSIEHVQEMVKPVLRHRIAKSDRAKEHKVHSDELIDDILEKLAVPKAA